MSKHTPGPWMVDEKRGYEVRGTYSGDFVADCFEGQVEETDKANARLVAAAPEMAEALRIALDVLDAHDDGFSRSAAPIVRAALEKAGL